MLVCFRRYITAFSTWMSDFIWATRHSTDETTTSKNTKAVNTSSDGLSILIKLEFFRRWSHLEMREAETHRTIWASAQSTLAECPAWPRWESRWRQNRCYPVSIPSVCVGAFVWPRACWLSLHQIWVAQHQNDENRAGARRLACNNLMARYWSYILYGAWVHEGQTELWRDKVNSNCQHTPSHQKRR